MGPTPRPPSHVRILPRSLLLVSAGSLLVLGATLAGAVWSARGPAALSVLEPREGQRIGLGGVAVRVRFDPGQVAAGTFRALLNGADVTEEFSSGSAEARARLCGLLDGENVLRLEVFESVEPWWAPLVPGGRSEFSEIAREIRVLHRRPLDLDRG
jgi:hypothetical protein